MKSFKIAILAIALITVVGTASSTTLQNIEEIQPVGTQAIDVTGEVNLNGNSLSNIGSLGNCGANEFVAGDGTCTTDSVDPDTVIQDNQQLSISGHTISLDNGGSVTVPDNTIADNQGLSDVLSNGDSVSGGQTIDASSGTFRLPVGTDAY